MSNLVQMIYANIDPISNLIGDWMAEITIPSIVIRLVLAIFLGGAIGIERSTKKHAAGLRTYILVCLGSTLAMLTNQFIYQAFEGSDASRIGAQVVNGIGFLGAGTIIITSRNRIKGLTTAAGIWACACIGLSLGIGFYTAALIAFVIVFLSILYLPKLENCFTKNAKRHELHIELETRQDLKLLINYLRGNSVQINAIEKNAAYASSGLSVYTINISLSRDIQKKEIKILDLIKQLEYVNYVEEIY